MVPFDTSPLVHMTNIVLSREGRVYERKVPSILDALSFTGGFIDICYLIVGSLYWFFAGTFIELSQASAFAELAKLKNFPKLTCCLKTRYFMAKRFACDQAIADDLIEDVHEWTARYLSLETIHALC